MLRDYQIQDVEKLRQAIRDGHRSVLYQLPVGGGKTVVMSEIMRSARQKGSRILFVAHRRELIWQTREKLNRFGIEPRVVMGNTHIPLSDDKVWVATVQSITSKKRINHLPEFDLIVFDEAHRSVAPSYKKLATLFPSAAILGMTATPVRSDGKGLGNLYSTLVQGPTIPELIEQKFLVKPKYYVPNNPDLKNVRVRNGDYVEEDLEKVMIPIIGDSVEWWQRLAEGRKTIVFASSVLHSRQMEAAFQEAGIRALHVDGTTPTIERDKIFEEFRRPDGAPILANCEVAVEGTDIPETSCIIVARPTKSLVRWIQMIGRGLRAAPHINKEDCLILDHGGNVLRLGFVEDWNEWYLEQDYRKEVEKKKTSSQQSTLSCPHCKAVLTKQKIVIAPQGPICPDCLQPLGRKHGNRRLEVIDGEPVLVTKSGIEEILGDDKSPIEFYRELRYYAAERGYKNGWAAHIYRIKYGKWPDWQWQNLPPLPASPLTRYLAKKFMYRNIKEQKKQAAQEKLLR